MSTPAQRAFAGRSPLYPSAMAAGLIGLAAIALLLLGGVSTAGTGFVIAGIGVLALLVGLRSPGEAEPAFDGHWLAQVALLGLPLLAIGQAISFAFGPRWDGPVTATLAQCALLISYLFFFRSATAVLRTPAQLRLMILGLFLIGVAEAVYGSLNLLAGNGTLLLLKRWAYFDSATGTLVNRNHFAYLLEMTIPIGFLVASTSMARSDSRPLQRGHETEHRARGALLGLTVAVMMLALLLSRSRMGLASLVAASGIVLGLDRVLRPSVSQAGPPADSRGIAIVIVGSALFLLVGVGVDLAFERFARATTDLEVGRLPTWQDAWAMVKAHPLLGSGFGSFEYLNASYRSGPTGFYVTHAHCDYLEVLAEAGIVGIAVVAAWVGLFLRRLLRTLRLALAPQRRACVLATAIGIVAVMLHSTVDFGLRVPGVTLTLLLVVAVFLRVSADTGEERT